METKQTRIIAIINEKGGVGKTVTVINLAAALTRLDMDPQANATRGLGFNPDDNSLSVYNMLSDPWQVTAANVIKTTPWQGLDLIPSHMDLSGADMDLSGAEVELVDREGREDSLKTAMATINNRYDFILVDTPPSLSLLTVNVLAYVRELIIPCQTHPYAFIALTELFDTIKAVKAQINPKLTITGIVPTFVDLRTRVSNMILEKLQETDFTKELLFKTQIRTNTTIADSAIVGKPVVFYRGGAFGAVDYADLAAEVLEKKPLN